MLTRAKRLYQRRRQRARSKLRQGGQGRPRLSVFRSSQQIYAQVIDDRRGATLAAASSLDKAIRAELGNGANIAAAGVRQVVFDRGGYKYHGRVKAVADAAREGGLAF